MRWPLALLMLIVLPLGACSKAPDFDQRYAQQAAQLEANASNMQQDIARQIAVSDAAHQGDAHGNDAVAPADRSAP